MLSWPLQLQEMTLFRRSEVSPAGENARRSHKNGATKSHDLASSGHENELHVTQTRAL